MQFATAYNLRKTSRLFFFGFALAYLITYLLARNGIAPSFTGFLAGYLDLPAIFCGVLLLTGGVLEKIDLEEVGHHYAVYAVSILSFGVLTALTLLDFLSPA